MLGAGLTLIVATGGTVWLARRREQGRPAPRLERAWPAVLWGQPVGILLAALAGFAGMRALPVYGGATIATLPGTRYGRSPAAIDGIGRTAVALLSLAVGAIHLATT